MPQQAPQTTPTPDTRKVSRLSCLVKLRDLSLRVTAVLDERAAKEQAAEEARMAVSTLAWADVAAEVYAL